MRIDLDSAYFYAKCISVHPTYQEILTIDPNRYDMPVAAADELSFLDFRIFPLSHALLSGRLDGQVEDHLSDVKPLVLPRFKFAVRDNAGQSIYWWLWDGHTIEIAAPDQDISLLPERKLTSVSKLISYWLQGKAD